MRRLDLIGGIFFVIFGLLMILVIIPLETEEGMYYGLPPTFFPTLLASGLTVCAFGLTMQALVRINSDREEETAPISRWNLLIFGLLVATIFAGIVLVDVFGLLVGAPLLIAVLMVLLGDRSVPRILGTAILPVGAVYYLALHVLQTPVP